MKYHVFTATFVILLLSVSISRAQNTSPIKYDVRWERYTTAWVDDDQYYRTRYQKVDTNKQLTDLKITDMRLYIPQNPYVTMPNGNKYIKAFLINNTRDSVVIDRSDATLSTIETEIKVGKEWKLFQVNNGSSCGNSYYSTKLASRHYLGLQIEDRTAGNIKVPYRVIAYNNKQKLISNETTIQISNELLKLAGTPLKKLAL